MKTRTDVLSKIRNAKNPYRVAEQYLLNVENLWMPGHLASATNRLVQESCGQIHVYQKISNKLFL